MTEPQHNPALIGHEDALRQVEAAFASGRMHHAWLISGIEGIGKATLAFHIAHHVLSNGAAKLGQVDLRQPSSKLILAEAHPDMLVLRRTANDKGELRETIPVEDALKLANFFHKTATHNGWRVALIDEAHALNRHGQNAILKILEEPPPRGLIIMTATSPGALLPTIRSRCRLLSLSPLNDAQMTATLNRLSPETTLEELTRLIALSGGSAGFALKLIRTEALPLYGELCAILSDMPALDTSRVHKLADRISRKADIESFEAITGLLDDLLRRAVRAQAAGESGDTALPLPRTLRLEQALQLWDRTRAVFALADSANLDRKLAFVNAMSDIRRAVA